MSNVSQNLNFYLIYHCISAIIHTFAPAIHLLRIDVPLCVTSRLTLPVIRSDCTFFIVLWSIRQQTDSQQSFHSSSIPRGYPHGRTAMSSNGTSLFKRCIRAFKQMIINKLKRWEACICVTIPDYFHNISKKKNPVEVQFMCLKQRTMRDFLYFCIVLIHLLKREVRICTTKIQGSFPFSYSDLCFVPGESCIMSCLLKRKKTPPPFPDGTEKQAPPRWKQNIL